MSDSLATLITKVQATLLDDGTRFTTATVTAAVRLALAEFNQRAPMQTDTILDVIADVKEYDLSEREATALAILNVLEVDSDGDDDQELEYDAFNKNDFVEFRLRTALSSGELRVCFSKPYTVNGLDGEVESTLPAFWVTTLLSGACFWSLQIRSVGRVETINLNQDVSKNLIDAKRYYRQVFDAGLVKAAARFAMVGERGMVGDGGRGTAWNDSWHGWGQ